MLLVRWISKGAEQTLKKKNGVKKSGVRGLTEHLRVVADRRTKKI